MKEITSKKSGNSTIISEETWDKMIETGMSKRFTVTEVKERKLIEVPKIVPKEVKTKTVKNG